MLVERVAWTSADVGCMRFEPHGESLRAQLLECLDLNVYGPGADELARELLADAPGAVERALDWLNARVAPGLRFEVRGDGNLWLTDGLGSEGAYEPRFVDDDWLDDGMPDEWGGPDAT